MFLQRKNIWHFDFFISDEEFCLCVLRIVTNQFLRALICFSSAVFERLRNILHSAEIDKRVQYMIEVMFAIRKDGFKVFTSVGRFQHTVY